MVSHLVLVLLLGIVMSAAISNFSALGRGVDRVLENNYKSIAAAQQMQDGLLLDLAAYGNLLDEQDQKPQTRANQGRTEFEAGLVSAKQAINEVGERDVLVRIEDRYEKHRALLESALNGQASGAQARAQFALDESVHISEIRTELSALVNINQNAMQRESQRAKALVQQAAGRSIAVAAIAMIFAIVMTIILSRSLLKPLRTLVKRAVAIGEGNLEDRLDLPKTEEFASLASAINMMSEKLHEERGRDQRRLRRAELMSDQALESLYDPVIVTDAKGQIAYLNNAAEVLFGPSPTAPRTPIIEHIGDQRIVRAIERAVDDQVVVASEDETSLVPLKIGDLDKTYRLRATPMKDDHGQMLGAVTVLEDITHLKELDRLKSEFIGVASHELRTPVTSLLMSVQLLEEGAVGELTGPQKEVLAVQRQDLERLNRLMQELLDISKLEAGTTKMSFIDVNPADLVTGAIAATRSIANEKKIEVSPDLVPNLKPVHADQSQIERVLINLLSNAIRHTSPGGHVKVRASSDTNQVTFSIEDDGEGIPKEYLDHIFDRFVQVPGATGGGAGLGLSIAHNIVKAHGGTIWADSELGAGSTFTFTLPRESNAVGDHSS